MTTPENPFEERSPEELQTLIDRVEGRLKDMELQDIVGGDVLPDDLPQPDLYGPKPPEDLTYRPEDWEV